MKKNSSMKKGDKGINKNFENPDKVRILQNLHDKRFPVIRGSVE